MTITALPSINLSDAHRALIEARVAAVVADADGRTLVAWLLKQPRGVWTLVSSRGLRRAVTRLLTSNARERIVNELDNPHHTDRPAWARGPVDYPDKFVYARARQIAEDELGIPGKGGLTTITVTPFPDAA